MFLQMAQRLTGRGDQEAAQLVAVADHHQKLQGGASRQRRAARGVSRPNDQGLDRSDARCRRSVGASGGGDRHLAASRRARSPSATASASAARRSPPPPRAAGRPSRCFSASAMRPCRPTTSARLARTRGSAPARGYGRGATSPPPSADPSKARRTARDWTAPTARRARSSARSHNIAAPPRTGRVDRATAPCADRMRQSGSSGVWARPSTSNACWKLPLSASARP